MRVRAVDGSESAGVRLMLKVVEHAEDAPDGTWLFAMGALVDPGGGMWTLSGDDAVERLQPVGCACGHVEYTTYRDGAEISRIVRSTR